MNRFSKFQRRGNSSYAQRRRAAPANEDRLREVARLEAIEQGKKRGLAPVGKRDASKLRAHGVPVEDSKLGWQEGTTARLHLVPESCAKLLKQWEEAQLRAGPAGHIEEFRSLKRETVLKLAADEWKVMNGGRT